MNGIYDYQVIECPCCGEKIVSKFDTARCERCGWWAAALTLTS